MIGFGLSKIFNLTYRHTLGNKNMIDGTFDINVNGNGLLLGLDVSIIKSATV